MFYKLNQSFRTTDALTIGAFITLVTFIFGTVLSHTLENRDLRASVSAVEILAFQIAHANDRNTNSRNPASVSSRERAALMETWGPFAAEGTVGSDQWGRPYHYRLLRDPDGNFRSVAIWTAGPDGVSNTQAFLDRVSFQGDDIGLTRPLL